MKEKQELRNILDRIDRKGYPAYKELKGVYKFDEYIFRRRYIDPYVIKVWIRIRLKR